MGYLTGSSGIIGERLAALAVLVFASLILLILALRARRGHRPSIRPIRAFDQLPDEIGKAAEAGASLHIGLGTGGIGGSQTLTSLAGLQVLEGISDAAVACGIPPVVTVGDATLLPLAQDAVRRAYIRAGMLAQYRPTCVRFIAFSPAAYALGARDVMRREEVQGNVLAGLFEEEVALLAQDGAELGFTQSAAADRLRAVGALYAADTRLAAGEELYAAGARLKELPRYLASLSLQDWLRFLLVIVILLAIVGIRLF
jgi:hypothetical protein